MSLRSDEHLFELMTPFEQSAGTVQCDVPDRERSREHLENHRVAERAGCKSLPFRVTLLTGGGDRPYALGMACSLVRQDIAVDFIGSDELDAPELHRAPLIKFLNLRGDQTPNAPLYRKITRIFAYYARLMKYVSRSEARIFHILWNNKFELIDRTFLMLYYKSMGKRILLTAHNVNTQKRDARDSFLNRLSLRIQYRLSDQIFVHSRRTKSELVSDFGVAENKVSVIPFGINNTVPNTRLSTADAKRQFGISKDEKTLLFFGNIAPYKGLEYLTAAFNKILKKDRSYRLIIAGRVKACESYWRTIEQSIASSGESERIIQKIEYIPDEQTEIYFKAADVLVLPYTSVFQSGVLFLGYAFGLPAIATNVGSLGDDIIQGETGFLCQATDSDELARAIRTYFASNLYENLETRRSQIQQFANKRHSWTAVGELLERAYRQVLLVK